MAVDAGPTLIEQLSFSSAARPFKNPAFTRVMSKRNETLKQIVTTEREAALGLITSGKRKGKRPTAVEAAAVMAAGGVAAEAPFELTIKGPGGRKMRLVGAAARAAQARQLREQKAKEDADAEASGMVGDDVEAGAGAELEAGNADVQDAIMEDAEVKDAEELIAPSTSAMATPVPEEANVEGSMESTPVPVALLEIKPRTEGASCATATSQACWDHTRTPSRDYATKTRTSTLPAVAKDGRERGKEAEYENGLESRKGTSAAGARQG
ncbi:unnamed protein product [Tilletia caries]|nr:unnamed protein product [Tilletia caries]